MTRGRARWDACSTPGLHTTGGPTGYGAWFDWAERMARTHVQVRCPGCGLYKVWRPFLCEGRDLRVRPAQQMAVCDGTSRLAEARGSEQRLCVVEDQEGRVAVWMEPVA
jgi:hypothetical protein